MFYLSARNSEKKRRKEPKRLGSVQPNLSSVWHTGLSGGAPDSVRCARLASGEQATLGKNQRRTTIIHRTVWWANGLQRNGRQGHRTVRCIPDSVRCAIWPRDAMVICARIGRRSAPDRLQWLSGGAPDCLVRHPTEGKDNLPCWPPTAPSCLGAIKGTPRRMEELPKLTRNILRLQLCAFDSLR
jgi:hypothetical protein